MKGNRATYGAAVGAIGLAALFSFIAPLVIRITIDSIISDAPVDAPLFVIHVIEWMGGRSWISQNLWTIFGFLAVASILQGLFTYLKGRWAAQSSEATARHLRDQLYNHLQHLPFSYHSKAATGDLIQRCTSDVETVRRFLSVQFVGVGRAVIMLSLVVPIMLSLNVQMTFISLALLPIIIAFAIIFFMKVKAAFQLSDESEGELSIVLQENLTGIRVVRAFARQEHEIEKFDRKNKKYRDLTYRLLQLLAWYWSISDVLCLSQIGLVLTIGSLWATNGVISLGTLVVFMTYSGMLMWPVRQMGRILTDMGKTIVSLERIGAILDEPIEGANDTVAPKRLPHTRGDIEVKQMTFSYISGTPVLKNINFQAKAGQTVAVMGPTGSGKSTLVNLLPRLYDYEKGSISLDGHPLSQLDRKWLREQIGIVLQEPFLYSKTVRENIRLGQSQAEDDRVYEAARIASIHDAILNFDKGYKTVVGERGVTLSGGQKQRVAIARAIIKNAPILIFDDSLSAVDTETEVKIQQALKKRRGRSTTFIIAHRLTTVMEADLILVLDNGEITQSGTHDELVAQNGLYRRVWNIQNSLESDFQKELDKK
ncbi:MAG: ABC transporter [Candidatus Cloacimonetes bacterium 4572_55]|nr:MAG: ABC transporter [Candidatus Cloacimonetes bacterium 4572_55]